MTCPRWIFSRAAERRCHLLRRHPRKQGLAPATWQRLASRPGSQLIDVRTRAEWTYVAIPDLGPIGKRAVLVEWQTFPDQTVDPRFVERLAGELKALGASSSFAVREAGAWLQPRRWRRRTIGPVAGVKNGGGSYPRRYSNLKAFDEPSP